MKKSLFTTGCCVAALMSANVANADIILNGVTTAGPDATLVINNNDLRTQNLTINAANGGGSVTFNGGGSQFGQGGTPTVDIQAGTFTATRNVFLGNGGAANSSTFIVSGGDAFFTDLGIARDRASGLLEISAGSVTVSGALAFDVFNGTNAATAGSGTLNFTAGSTGSLTAATIQVDGSATGGVAADLASYQALFTSGNLTFDGSNDGVFSEIFQVTPNGTTGATLSLIPEPASLALVSLGTLAMAGRRRRA